MSKSAKVRSDALDAHALLSVLLRARNGDFSTRMPLDWTGVAGKIADGLNDVLIANQSLEAELARVSEMVGQQGQLSQRVTLSGTQSWSGSVQSVNSLLDALVRPTSEMQRVIGAVAGGDLSMKVSADVRGEMLDLKNTINAMVDQLNGFVSELTRVAREVGTEGKLGQAAAVTEEVGGVWKDLTDNVNLMAANLTNQVRAIAEVATAVTEGDLTRQVSMEANGEVAALKDKLNEMIRNLRETTRQNIEQDWLKTNRERFTRMLQGQRDLSTVSSMILSELAPLVSAQHGVFYTMSRPAAGVEPELQLQAGYGYEERKRVATSFRVGVGLVGQCAFEKKRILLTDVPGDYIAVSSGLGAAKPLNIIVLPVLFEGSVRAVVELASFSSFSPIHQTFLDQLTDSIGLVLHTIEANTLTETLLKQSQSQAEELRKQQEELRESNEDLGRQARLLAEQNLEAERKNLEVEESKQQVEEKAAELSASSKYKSEFIANMSHELRTPLNSLLILAQQLEDNPDHNMTATQVEYASVIRQSGKDLLGLLNNILDLAKVESGTVRLSLEPVVIEELRAALAREFAVVARDKDLELVVEIAPGCPSRMITDAQRLGQIVKNLLVNALKFTATGTVSVCFGPAEHGWDATTASLADASAVMSITVTDTGAGVELDQQQRIFEPFAQADGTSARLYGGTGLGLSISRELAGLLGGEITLVSAPGAGSTFTVYLPVDAASASGDLPVNPDVRSAARPEFRFADVAGSTKEAMASLAPDRRDYIDFRNSGFDGMQVLVVDDDFRNIFAMTALLERGGITVISAESGQDALTALGRAPHIDVVLMDIMMPVMDGYATIRAIRAIEQFAKLPIIAVTGKVMAGERERCLAAGADGYVPKPVDTADILAVLTPWLNTVAASAP